MTCETCGREIKDYGVFMGGVRCPNYCWHKACRDEIAKESRLRSVARGTQSVQIYKLPGGNDETGKIELPPTHEL